MKHKTISGIRVCNTPVFIALASGEKTFSLAAFQDKANGAFLLANAGKDNTAFSPIDGKKMEALSVGEVATGVSELKNDYKEVAKCVGKCNCTMYAQKSIADLLVASGEKKINCTACGAEMSVAVAASDEDEDETIDDDAVGDSEDDEEVVMSEDEEGDIDEDDLEEIEPDAGEDDVLDEETVEGDEEDETEMSDDEEEDEMSDDEVEDDEELDAEVAALLREVADESDENPEAKVEDKPSDAPVDEPSDVVVAHVLHAGIDLKQRSRIVFVNQDTAWLVHAAEGGSERQVGIFNRAKAQPKSAELYDRRDVFGKTAMRLVANGDLATEQPSDELTKLGFEAITIDVPLTVAQAKVMKEAEEAATKTATETAAAQLTDVADNFNKLVAIAAVGMDKGVIKGSSLYKELAALLTRCGVRKADVVARQFSEGKTKPFLSAVIAQAKELASKDASYVDGLSTAVKDASYAPMESDTDETNISTAMIPNQQPAEVASLDDHRPTARASVSSSQIQGALRRIGIRR